MKRIVCCLVTVFIFTIILSACQEAEKGNEITNKNAPDVKNTVIEQDTEQSLQAQESYSISVYTEPPNQNSSIRIQYPVFTGDGKDGLNHLIYNKVQEFAKIDSSLFSKEARLEIDYQSAVTLQNKKAVSIIFWGVSSIEGAAYETTNLIPLNIELQTLQELTFEDLYNVDDAFEQIFFEKAYFPTEPVMSSDDSDFAEMLMLQSPEYQVISPFCIEGNIKCFLKPDGIVLSIPAIHATGSDHFEAQINYSDIDEFYKPEVRYWE